MSNSNNFLTLCIICLLSCAAAAYDPRAEDDDDYNGIFSPDHRQQQADVRHWSVRGVLNPDGGDASLMPPSTFLGPLPKLDTVKRNNEGPSLSLTNPMDVLRQRMLMELARERMRQTQFQIEANAQLLNQLGKRSHNEYRNNNYNNNNDDDDKDSNHVTRLWLQRRAHSQNEE